MAEDESNDRGSLGSANDPAPFRTWIGRGWSITRRHVLWILLPLVSGLLSVVPVVRALGHEGVSVNPTPTFPGPIVDLWPIVGLRVEDIADIATPSAAVLLSLPTVVTVLFAGLYLGSLNDLLTHRRPSFRRNLVRFTVPIGLYALLWKGLLAGAFALSAVSMTLGAAAFVGFLFVAYRLWSTPYLAVAEDLSLLAAVRRAWRLSSGSGPYRQFSIYVLLTTLVLSIPRVYGVLTARPVVLVGSVVVLAPVATVLTVASLGFVRSLIDAERGPEDDRARSDS